MTDVSTSCAVNMSYIVRVVIPVLFSVLIYGTTADSARCSRGKEVLCVVNMKVSELVNTYAQPVKGKLT